MKYIEIFLLSMMFSSCLISKKIELGPSHKHIYIHRPISVINFKTGETYHPKQKSTLENEISMYIEENTLNYLFSKIKNPQVMPKIRLFDVDSSAIVDLALSALEIKIVQKKIGGYKREKIQNNLCVKKKNLERLNCIIGNNPISKMLLSKGKSDSISNIIIPVNIGLYNYEGGQYRFRCDMQPWYVCYFIIDFINNKVTFRYYMGCGEGTAYHRQGSYVGPDEIAEDNILNFLSD